MNDNQRFAVVAIPAQNEETSIERCLTALAMQRDEFGRPIPAGAFEILLLANNCTDATISRARALARDMPHALWIKDETIPPAEVSAGVARRRAMELAAARVREIAPHNGLIFTTDADSYAGPTWIANSFREFDQGVDCVAGYIDGHPPDIIRLGTEFVHRGRLEDTYLRAAAEIYARCDPRDHDPWPNHRVSSGASLAVTLSAYLSIGGLPSRPVGEDMALTQTLDRAGFKVRHSLDVCVFTSCRLDGRAHGGAADTMRERYREPDAFCDDDLEAALPLTRRALYKGYFRRRWHQHSPEFGAWLSGIGVKLADISVRSECFEDFWNALCAASPILKRKVRLRPSELPRQIARAEAILRGLRPPATLKSVPTGTHDLGLQFVREIA